MRNAYLVGTLHEGAPIPEPIEISLSGLPQPSIAHAVVSLGWEPSVTQAQKNGLKGPATLGMELKRKGKQSAIIVK